MHKKIPYLRIFVLYTILAGAFLGLGYYFVVGKEVEKPPRLNTNIDKPDVNLPDLPDKLKISKVVQTDEGVIIYGRIKYGIISPEVVIHTDGKEITEFWIAGIKVPRW